MRGKSTSLSMIGRASLLFTLTVLLFAGLTNVGRAAGYAILPVVKPISSCADLTKTDLSKVADTPGVVKSAEIIDSDKGPFCKVTSQVAPEIVVDTYLPTERWTQRYFQAGGDGVAGPNGYSRAGTCQPALNGEFVYSNSNQGFQSVVGEVVRNTDRLPNWVPDPQKRIDYAYRATHVTVQVSKTLMKAYYGQAPRYSYFMGCSEGGRQALVEVQRYPEDFDGVSAGAPAIVETAEESTFHLWKVQADKRADGTNILMPEKLKLLHDAVVAQCDTLSSVKDGVLQDPAACHFNSASLQCSSASTDLSSCLTAEELTAIHQLYDGAHDDQGNYFYFGLQLGSEAQWNLPKTATAEPMMARLHAIQLAYIILPEASTAFSNFSRVTITKADFERASTLSSLFDAANTDLKSFATHGGKLILWHGLSDSQIPAAATMAYYRAVQKFMGIEAADKFVRAFILPGVGHCGDGDGYDQIDMLSPLMAWTELKQAPAEIVTGKTNEHGGPSAAPSAARGNTPPPTTKPFATPALTLTATRPAYPYPYIARYTGKGDLNDASSYMRAESPANTAQTFKYEALKLIGPDNQRNYGVKDGRVVVLNAR